MTEKTGTDMFPRALMERFPLLPLEEEGRLNDMPLRENFIERVFAYYRWTERLKNDPTPGSLVPGLSGQDGQVPHRPQAHPHGPQPGPLHRDGPASLGLRVLGTKSVAKAGAEPWDEMVPDYGGLLMEGMSALGTRGKHVNVLQHLMGYLKNELSGTAGKTRGEFLATPEPRPHRVRGDDGTEGGWQSMRTFLSFYTIFYPPPVSAQ